jgi:hypothetical protein
VGSGTADIVFQNDGQAHSWLMNDSEIAGSDRLS